jgi:hypothetical protein
MPTRYGACGLLHRIGASRNQKIACEEKTRVKTEDYKNEGGDSKQGGDHSAVVAKRASAGLSLTLTHWLSKA